MTMINTVLVGGGALLYLYIGYQAFRHRRTFWFCPTAEGFKTRRTKRSSPAFANFVGTISLAIGVLFLYLFASFLV